MNPGDGDLAEHGPDLLACASELLGAASRLAETTEGLTEGISEVVEGPHESVDRWTCGFHHLGESGPDPGKELAEFLEERPCLVDEPLEALVFGLVEFGLELLGQLSGHKQLDKGSEAEFDFADTAAGLGLDATHVLVPSDLHATDERSEDRDEGNQGLETAKEFPDAERSEGVAEQSEAAPHDHQRAECGHQASRQRGDGHDHLFRRLVEAFPPLQDAIDTRSHAFDRLCQRAKQWCPKRDAESLHGTFQQVELPLERRGFLRVEFCSGAALLDLLLKVGERLGTAENFARRGLDALAKQ